MDTLLRDLKAEGLRPILAGALCGQDAQMKNSLIGIDMGGEGLLYAKDGKVLRIFYLIWGKGQRGCLLIELIMMEIMSHLIADGPTLKLNQDIEKGGLLLGLPIKIF